MAVRYQVVDGRAAGPELDGTTRDLSLGGAFIVTKDPLPAGTKLAVTLVLPGAPLTVGAEVRWVADGDDEREHGMGVRFSGLKPDELRALNDFFATLTATVDHDDLG